MPSAKGIATSPWWAVAAVLITTVSVVYALAMNGQNATNTADIKEIKTQVHSLDIDRNVAKTEYRDLKETMLNGFQEQKESTLELKALIKTHMLQETGVSLLPGPYKHKP